jgi:nicotinic acid mononucleotide adenylyltransferase
MFLTEFAEPTILVIYPGRFQPFHKGHAKVFEYLTGKFGRNNVFIATSNKVEGDRSPFTFSEKSYFMQLTGVPADRIVEASQPYRIESILQSGLVQVANRENTVAIFAVSQKDMEEDPRFKSWSKKDGSPAYFQPLTDLKQARNINEHSYILTVPTYNFAIAGQPMRSGTELRAMYASADPKVRQQIITDLFGRYTLEAEEIMDRKLGAAPVEQQKAPIRTKTKLQTVKEEYNKNPNEKEIDPRLISLLSKAHIAYPRAHSDQEALMLFINHKLEMDELEIGQVEHDEHDLESKVRKLELQLAELKKEIPTKQGMAEAGGVGVVKGGNDSRYSTATMGAQNDVNGDTLGKEMDGFMLTGRKSPGASRSEKPVNKNVGKGVK